MPDFSVTAPVQPAVQSAINPAVFKIIFKSLNASLYFWIALVVIILVIAFFVIFKAQIAHFIFNLKRAKFSKDGVDLTSDSKEVDNVSAEKKEEEGKKDTSKEEPTEEDPTTHEGWHTEMFFASIMRNKERFEHSHTELLKLSPDTLSKKKDEIFYLQLKHNFGDTQALASLKELLKDLDTAYDVNVAIGRCYSDSDDFKNANLYYEAATTLATNDQEKSRLARAYSESLYSDNQKEKAIIFLDKTISEISSDTERANLYEKLGNIYEKEKDYANRAFVLDKALELKPNDSGLLFDTAYSY